jgi:hypothetical protein
MLYKCKSTILEAQGHRLPEKTKKIAESRRKGRENEAKRGPKSEAAGKTTVRPDGGESLPP